MNDASHDLQALGPALWHHALHLTGSENDAEALLRETLRRAKLDRVSLNADVGDIWGPKVRMLTILHDAYHRGVEGIQPPGSGPTADAQSSHREEIRFTLLQLPALERQAVLLVDVEGLSYWQASTVMRVSTGSVLSHLTKARARLSALLDAGGGQDDQSAAEG
jgi:RNA polymerase sigma-70 factor (ECF subfamily)